MDDVLQVCSCRDAGTRRAAVVSPGRGKSEGAVQAFRRKLCARVASGSLDSPFSSHQSGQSWSSRLQWAEAWEQHPLLLMATRRPVPGNSLWSCLGYSWNFICCPWSRKEGYLCMMMPKTFLLRFQTLGLCALLGTCTAVSPEKVSQTDCSCRGHVNVLLAYQPSALTSYCYFLQPDCLIFLHVGSSNKPSSFTPFDHLIQKGLHLYKLAGNITSEFLITATIRLLVPKWNLPHLGFHTNTHRSPHSTILSRKAFTCKR